MWRLFWASSPPSSLWLEDVYRGTRHYRRAIPSVGAVSLMASDIAEDVAYGIRESQGMGELQPLPTSVSSYCAGLRGCGLSEADVQTQTVALVALPGAPRLSTCGGRCREWGLPFFCHIRVHGGGRRRHAEATKRINMRLRRDNVWLFLP
ncbi:unnamed protein product [Musa hybrid cultivar]